MLRKIPLTTALLALFAAGVLLGAACSDDDDDAGAQDAELTAVQEQAEKGMLLAALTGLRAIPLHDISEELQTADAIPDGVASDIETARQITVGTDWPAGLDDLAAELETNLDSFMQALDDEDLEASKGTSIEVHQAWHELDSTGYPYYAAEDTAAGGDHEENGSGPGHEEDSTETPSS